MTQTLTSPAGTSTGLAIRTQHLTKRFDRHTALREVDLEIQSGAVFGLIGPNGAGKTTLIRLLAMAESPTLGEVFFHGEKLDYTRPQFDLKRQIGYLPDDFPLYEDLNVWDYLDYFARLYGLQDKQRSRSIHQVLDLVNLGHKRKSVITSLSRGMKQRLGLARSVIHTPSILLLDEPVSGLDPVARQEFRQVIRNLHGLGITVLISSHVLSDLAELCTAIGILEFGYLVENAPLETLYQRLSQQHIVIGTRGDLKDLQTELRQFDAAVLVLEAKPQTGQVKIRFSGDPDEAADLLRSLVEAKIPLYEFHCEQESLEDIFFKIGHLQPT
ncbi:ABC transporter ATP-binding protein [Leptothoe kymatousa]|uniref:ABC transporter ATP-binding protein n=1 Tax=Leptothoe kymatousa TAU-MAC 1615 TaxID=2364775 RepID=A0ABS5Y2I1_9CYAN|nr:ABC transporter ATP-binding protein [Leptothoe kymatousa]MBT9312021.1 ABC transporter ATP-binding protein [Leptothoe kymatousa TAU-MAC 1615]